MKIITLCGSTRFKKQFEEVNAALTMGGHIVLSLGFFEKSENFTLTPEQEKNLGELHFKKIDLSNEIFVIDVDGYIGSSTQKEIEYAKEQGKQVNYYSRTNLQPLLNQIG